AGVRLRPTLRLDAESVRRVRALAAAGLAGLLAQQLLVLVTVRLATSAGGVGTINVYQYTQAVYLLPYAVLAVPLATASFPALAGHAARDDGERFAAGLERSTRAVVLLAVAGAAVLVAVAPAVGAVFTALRGGSPALPAMPVALTAYAPGLVGFALLAHLGRALFAVHATRWVARCTVAGWGTAVLASLALVPLLAGTSEDRPRAALLALGTASSLGMTLAGGLLLVGAGRLRVGDVPVGGWLRHAVPVLLRCLVLAGLAAVAGRLATDLLLRPGMTPALLSGVVGAALAGAVLLGGLWLLDRDDLRTLLSARGRP
ncbi:MAG TPA: lipid II flippase MurJ, partial [Actinomycetales bacterium]|nr:lipid II flippase MurJ [Actinomycetales bacterium]